MRTPVTPMTTAKGKERIGSMNTRLYHCYTCSCNPENPKRFIELLPGTFVQVTQKQMNQILSNKETSNSNMNTRTHINIHMKL